MIDLSREIAWRKDRSRSFLHEAQEISKVAPLSARTAAYYASFHACHVLLLTDERFDETGSLANLGVKPEHRFPIRHKGRPSGGGNVGLAWVLSKMHPQVSGRHQYLRQASESARYQDLTGTIVSVEKCLLQAETVLRTADAI